MTLLRSIVSAPCFAAASGFIRGGAPPPSRVATVSTLLGRRAAVSVSAPAVAPPPSGGRGAASAKARAAAPVGLSAHAGHIASTVGLTSLALCGLRVAASRGRQQRARWVRCRAAASKAFDPTPYLMAEAPPVTKNYIMQQTMIRVKDPQVSLDFYTKVLGFHLVMWRDFPQWSFSVYFVAYCDKASIPTDPEAQWDFCMKCPGCVELTWNYGSESQKGLVYNTGNSDSIGSQDGEKVKGGFGHMGITVPDVYQACERFKELGVNFSKSPNGGGMKGLAFIKDPDGYLIEVLPQGEMITKPMDCFGVAADGGQDYVDKSK